MAKEKDKARSTAMAKMMGAWAPSSFSKAERVVADRAAGAGAKAAAAEATRRSAPRRRRKSGAR